MHTPIGPGQPQVPPSTPPADFLDAREAARFARLSLKSLQRAHAAGADTGLRKHGRRIVFHRPTLAAFLLGTPTRGGR